MRVSDLGLGTMTWGRDTDPLDASIMLTEFLDAGGTLVDTAAGYSDGGAEALLGEFLAGGISRSDVVIATKAGVRTWRSDRAVVDASRGTVLDSLDASLLRLGTDHVDILLVQSPRSGHPDGGDGEHCEPPSSRPGPLRRGLEPRRLVRAPGGTAGTGPGARRRGASTRTARTWGRM